MKKIVYFLIISLITLSSCKKYEEGPAFSLRTKKARLSNAWLTEKTIDSNGNEKVFCDKDRDALTTVFFKDGRYSFRYETSFFLILNDGKWAFTDDKEHVVISVEGEPDVEWEIIKLKNKSIALKKEDGTTHYFIVDEYYNYTN